MTTPVDWTGLTLAHARDLQSAPPAAQQRWRALLNAEIAVAARRNRELLRDRKPVDVRRRAEAILAAIPEEDPEVVGARRAILLDAKPPALCPCGLLARDSPWCEAHRARVRSHGDPLLHIPITSANRGGLLKMRSEAA